MFSMHNQTSKRRRLKLGILPLPMGVLVLSYVMALTSTASEAKVAFICVNMILTSTFYEF